MAKEVLVIEKAPMSGGGVKPMRLVEVAFFKRLVTPILRDGLVFVPRLANALPAFVSSRLSPTERADIDVGLLLWTLEQLVVAKDSEDWEERVQARYTLWADGILDEHTERFAESGRWLGSEV